MLGVKGFKNITEVPYKEVYLITKNDELIQLIRDTLEHLGYNVVSKGELKVFSLLPDRCQRVILIDSSIPGYSEPSEDLIRKGFIIIISDKKDKKMVLEAMRKGICGYLERPLNTEELTIIIDKLIGPPEKDEIITMGKGSKIKHVMREIKKLSEDNLPVLISGEDGIDLEFYARILHSKRHKNGLFLSFRPASEIEKIQSMIGYFKEENSTDTCGCSIFFDDFHDLDKEMIKQIIDIAGKRDLFLIGGTRLKLDINNERDKEIFRLFDKREIVIPPLRERREDIPIIIETILRKMERQFGMGRKDLSFRARSYLLRYHWPGNERQMEDTIRKAYLLSEDDVIEKRDLFIGNISLCSLEEFLSLRLRGMIKENSNLYPTVIGEVEKALISIVLQEVDRNQLRASKILGINRNTLRSKIKEYGLNRLLTK
ncbi:MAG: sigma-54-dependent transcriptional regulator [Thermodesulfovibrionales bacterium]